ncbi:MAG TPA: hypothetical protein PKD53_26580 [Chloroflexaceae bacterium]|nr:hypothetical protein [Chloroflexaceae bacterium]
MEAVYQLSEDTLRWLLAPDEPGPRYLALRDLLRLPADDPELRLARQAAHANGPIATILAQMEPTGFWAAPGPGYNPKYRSTVWSLIALAQLGTSSREDARIERACSYVLEHALTPGGQFSASGAPSGTADCLQGNLCWALLTLGCEPERLAAAMTWMVRSITGEGVAPRSDTHAPVRYYAGKCGPGFACGANNQLPCAWGATKVMLALSAWPADRHTLLITRAIAQGVEFLLGVDPATAAYPCGYSDKPSRNWWKFGFPVFYVTDVLQVVEALVALGHRADPGLSGALALIAEKGDQRGRWALEYEYGGKTWADFGLRGEPNKWVTIRALRALGAVAPPEAGVVGAAA